MLTGDDTLSGWIADGSCLKNTNIIREWLLELLRKKVRSVDNENKLDDEEKREQSGVFEQYSLSA